MAAVVLSGAGLAAAQQPSRPSEAADPVVVGGVVADRTYQGLLADWKTLLFGTPIGRSDLRR